MTYFRIKSNVIRWELWVKGTKALISSQNPPSQAGVPRDTWASPSLDITRWRKRFWLSSLVSSWCTWNLWISGLFQIFCHALSSGVNLKPKKEASPISVSCWQPDLGVQDHPWSKVDIRGQPPHPIQWVGPQGWGYLRANPRFGVFWFIPLLWW